MNPKSSAELKDLRSELKEAHALWAEAILGFDRCRGMTLFRSGLLRDLQRQRQVPVG